MAKVCIWILIDNIGKIVSCFRVMESMNHELFMDLPNSIMSSFISAIIIYSCPRADGPNIIELPVETSHIVRFIQSQTGNSHFESIRLHDLREIRVSREILSGT